LLGRLLWVAAIGWTLAVVVALWMPPPPVVIPNWWADKVTHLVMFIGVGGLWGVTTGKWSWVVVGGIALGALTEVGQEWWPWERHGDWVDFGFDSLGVLIGTAAARLVRPYVEYSLSPRAS